MLKVGLALVVSREYLHAVGDIAQTSFTQPSKLCSELGYSAPSPSCVVDKQRRRGVACEVYQTFVFNPGGAAFSM